MDRGPNAASAAGPLERFPGAITGVRKDPVALFKADVGLQLGGQAQGNRQLRLADSQRARPDIRL